VLWKSPLFISPLVPSVPTTVDASSLLHPAPRENFPTGSAVKKWDGLRAAIPPRSRSRETSDSPGSIRILTNSATEFGYGIRLLGCDHSSQSACPNFASLDAAVFAAKPSTMELADQSSIWYKDELSLIQMFLAVVVTAQEDPETSYPSLARTEFPLLFRMLFAPVKANNRLRCAACIQPVKARNTHPIRGGFGN
jgi:hypothetical protein